MYKNKKEVDAHVRAAFSKLRSESERHLRGFAIAKMYMKINEFASAEQYLCSYLSVKEDYDQAHKLLGQCYQRMKKSDKALQSYQRSLQLNPKQPDVLAEVCQLLLDDKSLNSNKAKYWCELAESEKVQHDAVFSLRLKLMNQDNLGTNQVEALLQKEISSKPNDVQLRVRLVRNYVEQNKVLDAFKYVHQLEMMQKDEFVVSNEWYNVVWLVLNKFENLPNTKKDWDFWLLLAICLERQIQISFALTSNSSLVGGGVTETTNLIFQFDQYLFKLSQLSDKLCGQKELVELLLNHYRGQLLLHAAALIFKRELLQNKNKWKETVRIALPLLLQAYQVGAPDNKEPWMKHCDEHGKLLISMWQREGSFRCAQAGRTLLSCVQDEAIGNKENAHNISNLMMTGQSTGLWSSSDELLAQVRQICGDRNWRRNVFALLFCNSDQKVKEQSSYFAKSSKLNEPIYDLPSYADVERYEDAAQYHRPQSLQHMVYLCLGNDNLSFVRAKYFSGLNFSTQNLQFCGAESLNQLDIDSFLYATAIQAKRALEVEREAFDSYQLGNSGAAGRPKILPFVNLQQQLCTEEQGQWWNSAYLVYKNLSEGSDLAEIRANLQYGIEAVRGINGPKLDMAIVFKLGQIFVARAQDMMKPVEKAFLEARAESIFRHGLNMIKMDNKGVLEPFRKYFKYAKAQTAAVEREVTAAADDSVSYLARRYFKKCEYEDLIEELSGVQLPFATYMQAEAYRKLDEASKTPKKIKRIYLDRASECLNQTLSLLKCSAHADSNHPLNSVIHNEIKRLQHASARYMSESSPGFGPLMGHNNSSTYEDAEEDIYGENSHLPTPGSSQHARLRRETSAANSLAHHNQELENLVKQMASTLSLVKEEIHDALKTELRAVNKEISSLKDKVSQLGDAMKKVRMASNPPSRDDASNVLDDFYIIEESLQPQLYQQPAPQPPQPANQYVSPAVGNGPPNIMGNSSFMTQQQRLQAAAFSPIFPATANYPMSFYGHGQPYMMAGQGANPAALNQRAPGLQPMPYIDPTTAAGAINFSLQPPSTSLLPLPSQPPMLPPDNSRSSNLFNLLQQPPVSMSPSTPILQNTVAHTPATIPSYSTPITHMALPPPIVSNSMPQLPPTPASATHQFNKALNTQPVEKGPPANVVITSSDPLPNPNSIALQSQQQPPLSVTIPSHHIKPSLVSQPPPDSLLDASAAMSASTFHQSNKPLATAVSSTATATTTTAQLFGGATFSSSTFSFKPQIAAAAAAAQGNVADSPNKTSESIGSDFNKSGVEDLEYDPRPDFKPIIPLPDEVEVRTGEEDEEVMFCYRAKLFRHVDKEWKERGIGDIKILKSKTGSSRILMRREQTHKICANHKITPEIVLTSPPQNESKGFIWAANDFADEELHLEKFYLRFKLPETAKQFGDAFRKAQKEAEALASEPDSKAKVVPPPFGIAKSAMTNFVTSTPAQKVAEPAVTSSTGIKPNLGKLSAPDSNSKVDSATNASKSLFSGLGLAPKTPITDAGKAPVSAAGSPFASFSFGKASPLPVTTNVALGTTVTSTTSSATASPFASIFSNLNKSNTSPFNVTTTDSLSDGRNPNNSGALNKSANSDNEEEYVPTAQFNPVIPLPDLVEVNTGEENEEVLFEHRAKLLRFDKETGEWKERGLGNIKLLQEKDNVNHVRLLMRREQVLKICCNQRISADTQFKYAKNSQTALTWAGQDFSENELVTEMLTVRFKLPETCKQFLDAIHNAQAKMTISSNTESTKSKAEPTETKTSVKGFGDAFKPKAGSWSCKDCYISNVATDLYCVACNSPKDDTVPKKEPNASILATSGKPVFSFGFSNASNIQQSTSVTAAPAKSNFTFGTTTSATSANVASPTVGNKATTADATKTSTGTGFGDAFKPKAGSWSCEGCYLSNSADAIYCKACDAPKDSTVPKKDANTNILALSNPSQKFSFGFGASGSAASTGVALAPAPAGSFSFGQTQLGASEGTKSFTFTPPSATSTGLSSSSTSSVGPLEKSTFTFSLSSKAMENPTMPSSTLVAENGAEAKQNAFSLDKKEFSFTMKPKSPLKSAKSPFNLVPGAEADDDDDGDYHEEEENNTHFTPVIPLPDKIDVKTGEEDEDPLYIHRAKLYRFVEGEWKERGLGNLKILRHKETGKLRVMMRREQVLKICLNHVLNEDVEYKRKDEKSWLFVVNDFSEGSIELQQFSLRFKSKEIAEQFMDIVQKALDGTAEVIEIPGNTSITTPSKPSTPGSAVNISDEDKKKADKLMLPYEFFAPKPTCPGCRGCDSDSFVFKDAKNIECFVHMDDINSLEPVKLPSLILKKAANRSILKQGVLPPAVTKQEEGTKVNDSIFTGFGGANSTAFGSSNADKTPVNTTFSFTGALNSDSTAANETKTLNTTAGGSGGFLFGSGLSALPKSTNIFGGTSADSKPAFGLTTNLFGGGSSTTATDLSVDADKTATKSIFGGTGNSNSSTGSIFSGTGGSLASGGSIFGGKPLLGTNSIFGNSANSTQSAGNATSNSIFGNSTFGGFGGSNNSQSAVFGSNTQFGNVTKDKTPSAASSPAIGTAFVDLSKTATAGLDFASLAAKSESSDNSLLKSDKKPGPGGFFGLTGQDAFSSFDKSLKEVAPANSSQTNTSANESHRNEATDDADGENDENYDPHYDPIIQLPNEVVVSTGEEEETKLFGERATLYRFDDTNKEWKERGVGEIKILLHPIKNSYRLVMRREQIHKLVLNHAVGAEFIFNKFNNNAKSFVWAAMNYAESSEGEVEKLAVRFKKVETAEEFSSKLNECIEKSKKQGAGT